MYLPQHNKTTANINGALVPYDYAAETSEHISGLDYLGCGTVHSADGKNYKSNLILHFFKK